jgi:hypothetical protein
MKVWASNVLTRADTITSKPKHIESIRYLARQVHTDTHAICIGYGLGIRYNKEVRFYHCKTTFLLSERDEAPQSTHMLRTLIKIIDIFLEKVNAIFY